MPSALELSGITKIYDEGKPNQVSALSGVTFSISKGELVSIVGSSGSGKSTLLHILGLLDEPTGGTFSINGENVSNLSQSKMAKKRNEEIGFVFQSFNLLRRTTVYRNIELPLLYSKKINKSERKERIMKVLREVGLEEKVKARTNELSGGQQQRVAIARALVMDPAFLLADEPTGNLDSKTSIEIMNILVNLNKNKGTTIIIVTHDPDVAKETPRMISLKDGSIIEDIQR